MRTKLIVLYALVLAAALPAAPSLAQSAGQPTARASAPLTIHSGPGAGYPAIGRLARNERVALEFCQPRRLWCELETGGWVDGSYLVGAAAKLHATPSQLFRRPFLFPRIDGVSPD